MHADTGSGFRDVEHTADAALEVWAGSAGELIRQAVLGMLHMMDVETSDCPKLDYDFKIVSDDHESLLIQTLNQIILTMELKQQAPKDISITMSGDTLAARITLVPVIRIKKMIKAATYNDLKMIQSGHGYQAKIVFDI
jgi:SHS2 domain-containing protein